MVYFDYPLLSYYTVVNNNIIRFQEERDADDRKGEFRLMEIKLFPFVWLQHH